MIENFDHAERMLMLCMRRANLVELERVGLEADAVALAALDVGGHVADHADARHGGRGRLAGAPGDHAAAGVLAELEPEVARHVEPQPQAPHRLLRRRHGHRSVGRSSPPGSYGRCSATLPAMTSCWPAS